MEDVENFLPHRYPFLFIDRIISFEEENKTLITQKNVSYNEQYFQGHFPQEKVMPGVIQVEALAQSFLILLKKLKFEFEIAYFAKIEEVSFKKIVKPGDILIFKVKLIKGKMGIFVGEGEVLNQDKEIVCTGKMTASLKKN